MQNINYAFLLSRPVWGAWIEIEYVPCAAGVFVSRAPYGARGLKLRDPIAQVLVRSVAPRMGRVD